MKKMMKTAGISLLKRVLPLLLALVLAGCSAGCACSSILFANVAEGVRKAVSGETEAPAVQPPAGPDTPGVPDAPSKPSAPEPSEEPDAPVKTPVEHPNIPFSEMVYEAPDTEALSSLLEDLLQDAEAGKPTKELLDRYDEALSQFNEASSQLSLCYVYYAHDVSDAEYRDEYTRLQAELNRIDLAMTDVALALLDRGDEALERWGEDFADAVVAGDRLNDESIQPLLEEEQKLVQTYDDLLSSFVLKEGGRTYTMEQIGEIAAQDYDEYYRLYCAYVAQLNAEAGEIYLDLLALRSDIAAKLGYGSYAAYGYDCYGRDFTVTEAQALHAAVKEYLVPLYYTYVFRSVYSEYDLSLDSFPFEAFVETLRGVLLDFSPQVCDALDYMIEYGLYDFEANENKMESSFTTYFANYSSPFMFTAWEDSFYNTGTLIHELGHYTNYFVSPVSGWSVSDSLDLAEVDSQGLELLMTAYFDRLYGSDEAAEAALASRLSDALYSVLSGCMEDEFQQAVYADPDMTLEEMNALYYKLAQEYGFADLYGYTGCEWTMIPHTFQTPMYYISYATSMIASLELWDLAQTDANAARNAYLTILQRGPYTDFRETLVAAGLADPLSADTIADIAQVLS